MKCLLLSAAYMDHKAVLKFYHPETNRLILWRDESGHKPHCYIDEEGANKVRELPGVEIEPATIFDTIKDQEVKLYKLTADNPLIIGGRDDSIRESCRTWESDIKYYQTYLYDNNYIVGKWYDVQASGITAIDSAEIIDIPNVNMDTIVEKDRFKEQLSYWAKLLAQPIPKIRRMAVDIEVESDGEKLPDPLTAPGRITAIAFSGPDIKKVFVLNRGLSLGEKYEGEYELKFYDSEKTMIMDSLDIIESYPVVLTYNGDMFDMPYIYNRAAKLGIKSIPLKMMAKNATLSLGVHLDMYGVFSNRSLKIYAFNAKYVEEGLESVSAALLDEHKIEHEESIDEMPMYKLAHYCYNDARLTYKLSAYNNDMVMNLLIILCRIGNMSIDDISRMAISNWCKSLFYFSHRQRNQLIPRSSDFPQIDASTVADIDGKKYRGAEVLDPSPGVHFDVTVMDFASLYPSIIKTRNISYETVCCPHEECKTNLVPQTKHWTCTKKQGIISLQIGSLKEIRVNYFKKLYKKTKDENYETISQALKVFLNASYGVIGFKEFPLYFLPTAECVTAVGRDIILSTVETAKGMGLTIIAGDTDSIFLKQPSKEAVQQLIDLTTERYKIDIEVDKEYRYVVFSNRKKNYFGIKKDGKADIKGLSGKKSNTPPFIRELFNSIMDILKIVGTPADFENAKKDISYLVKDYIVNFDNIPLQKMAFRVLINKDPSEYKVKTQVIKAAELLEEKPQKGQFISFVKTWNEPGVKPIQIVARKDIDKPKYLDSMQSILEQILEPMEIDFDLLAGRGKQMTLF